ncbi:MAG: right-handed parallel beta-helix repeat-containing protein [Phycisphaerales bacterium]|nr:MAG: right-handed parallel beta-helix repeat-containing protein [Phycisphaerales bacterium]
MNGRENKRMFLAMSLLIAAFTPGAFGRTLVVYPDGLAPAGGSQVELLSGPLYPSIQAAIDDSVEGDTIVLAGGTFKGEGNRDIDFKGKSITLRSTDPNDPAVTALTIIDCQGSGAEPHRAFYFHSAEDADCVVAGITITNGCASGDYGPAASGGAVYCKGSSPTFTNCIFKGNWADDDGGAIYNYQSAPNVANCMFVANCAGYAGGSVSNKTQSDATFVNCLFVGNASDTSVCGMWNFRSSPTLTNCTFQYRDSAMANSSASTPVVTNCIFWGMVAPLSGSPVVRTSCIQDADPDDDLVFEGPGNIDDDPLFADGYGADGLPGTGDEDLHLLPGSPCLDTGDTAAIGALAPLDLDGRPRVANGVVDMGPYEGAAQGIVLSTHSIVVDEGGSATFEAALAMDPGGTIEVHVGWASGDGDIGVVSPDVLLFNSLNYGASQTVTLDAAEDADYLNGSALIRLSGPGLNTTGLWATEWDNDVPKTIYVDSDASGSNNGSSWADAFADLQSALAVARIQPQAEQIHVAEGIYRPAEADGDRKAAFQLVEGIAVRGGYAGFGHPNPDARDIDAYETILSGDLNGNDLPGAGPQDPTKQDNACGVVTCADGGPDTLLEGFTITAGNANVGWVYERGGAMAIVAGSPTVKDCTFAGNCAWAEEGGAGGAIVIGSANPTFMDCKFLGNVADTGIPDHGAGNGGAIYSDGDPTLIRCAFIANSAAGNDGGAFYSSGGSPTFTDCQFLENSARTDGGAICGGAMTLTGCTFVGNVSTRGLGGGIFGGGGSTLSACVFTGNRALYRGGALHSTWRGLNPVGCLFSGNTAGHYGGAISAWGAEMNVSNCTFAGNRSPAGRAIACYSYKKDDPSDLALINCILWDGGEEIWNDDASTISITYSDFSGGWEGQGNIDTDPCFARAGHWDDMGTPDDANDDSWVDGDYHLKSQAGRWNQDIEAWTLDETTSQCIDAGDPAGPIGLEPFPNGGIVNMGAYGATAEAGKSYFGEPACQKIAAGDINGDCKVDFGDFSIMALHWLNEPNE